MTSAFTPTASTRAAVIEMHRPPNNFFDIGDKS